MSSPPANRSNRPNRPADFNTSREPVKSITTASMLTPTTANVISSSSDGLSSDLSEPEDTLMSDTLQDADVSSVSHSKKLFKENTGAPVENLSFGGPTGRANMPKASVEVTETEPKQSRKRTMPTQKSPVKKRVKVEESELERTAKGQVKLVYQTIKAIKMPRRKGTGPPTENERPYGAEETHENSMLIYWLDEQDKSYNEATQLFAQTFPEKKAVEEAIRRRHIRALQRLAKKYGVKKPHEIDAVGKNALRRGKTRAPRVVKVRADSPPDVDDTAGKVDRRTIAVGVSSPANPGAITKPRGPIPKYVKQQVSNIGLHILLPRHLLTFPLFEGQGHRDGSHSCVEGPGGNELQGNPREARRGL